MKVFIALLIISLYGTILGCEDGGEDPGMKDEIVLPKVVQISPSDGEKLHPDGGLSYSLRVVFNKPMAVETVEIAVGGVAGDITSNETHTEFTWTLQKWGLLCPGGLQPAMIQGRDEAGNPLTCYQPNMVNVVLPYYEPITIDGVVP
ncbi:MAG: hypothetical protein O7E52_10830, partial [Candidatus Poribacteria bacterium]|nr:hypothetical protein [Candidatus Poribacteria bacterium]